MNIVFAIPRPTQAMLQTLLASLVRVNMLYLRANPSTPRLLQSGVRYQPEESEVWQTIGELQRTKRGDCEDLACALAAELRVRGYGAIPFLSWKERPMVAGKTQGKLYHVRVKVGDKIVDPSKLLGM